MLIRLVCAVKDKKLHADLEKRLSTFDVQLKMCGRQKAPWQDLVRSCGDVFVVSKGLIPKPIESSVGMLNNLPEKPTTIILHDRESSEEHANLLASGADVVLYTGISMDSLVEAIESTIESRRQLNFVDRFDQRGRIKPKISDFISNSEDMQLFLDEVQQVVSTDSTLLLLGETGVGKEHLSKAIHAESHRSKGPFIAINMAAIPEPLMESELFGHEQGAFTGAVRSRRGAFELAHGGTIFLDEIGEMPMHMQSKLLRVLQDFEFTPVGGETSIWVDVRVIAATNKDLEEEISKQVVRSVIKRSVVVSHNPIFTCVPLHISRERWRGFNQAGILAMNISKSLGCRFFPDLVVRKKKTTPQVGLGKKERSKNLRDVFEVNIDRYGDCRKEKIIIFDDVVTTGTTMKEMAKALKKAGFDNVWGLAVAR